MDFLVLKKFKESSVFKKATSLLLVAVSLISSNFGVSRICAKQKTEEKNLLEQIDDPENTTRKRGNVLDSFDEKEIKKQKRNNIYDEFDERDTKRKKTNNIYDELEEKDTSRKKTNNIYDEFEKSFEKSNDKTNHPKKVDTNQNKNKSKNNKIFPISRNFNSKRNDFVEVEDDSYDVPKEKNQGKLSQVLTYITGISVISGVGIYCTYWAWKNKRFIFHLNDFEVVKVLASQEYSNLENSDVLEKIGDILRMCDSSLNKLYDISSESKKKRSEEFIKFVKNLDEFEHAISFLERLNSEIIKDNLKYKKMGFETNDELLEVMLSINKIFDLNVDLKEDSVKKHLNEYSMSMDEKTPRNNVSTEKNENLLGYSQTEAVFSKMSDLSKTGKGNLTLPEKEFFKNAQPNIVVFSSSNTLLSPFNYEVNGKDIKFILNVLEPNARIESIRNQIALYLYIKLLYGKVTYDTIQAFFKRKICNFDEKDKVLLTATLLSKEFTKTKELFSDDLFLLKYLNKFSPSRRRPGPKPKHKPEKSKIELSKLTDHSITFSEDAKKCILEKLKENLSKLRENIHTCEKGDNVFKERIFLNLPPEINKNINEIVELIKLFFYSNKGISKEINDCFVTFPEFKNTQKKSYSDNKDEEIKKALLSDISVFLFGHKRGEYLDFANALSVEKIGSEKEYIANSFDPIWNFKLYLQFLWLRTNKNDEKKQLDEKIKNVDGLMKSIGNCYEKVANNKSCDDDLLEVLKHKKTLKEMSEYVKFGIEEKTGIEIALEEKGNEKNIAYLAVAFSPNFFNEEFVELFRRTCADIKKDDSVENFGKILKKTFNKTKITSPSQIPLLQYLPQNYIEVSNNKRNEWETYQNNALGLKKCCSLEVIKNSFSYFDKSESFEKLMEIARDGGLIND